MIDVGKNSKAWQGMAILYQYREPEFKRWLTWFRCHNLLFPIDLQFEEHYCTENNEEMDDEPEKKIQTWDQKLAPSWKKTKQQTKKNKNIWTHREREREKHELITILGFPLHMLYPL